MAVIVARVQRRVLSFGYPGDDGLGDRLIAAVLTGEKTATSSLVVEYLADGEQLPRVGELLPLVDHVGVQHATVRTTRVRIVPLDLVDDQVARDEGEGFADAAAWRREHEMYWRKLDAEIKAESGDPEWTLRRSEPVVVQWFEVVTAEPDVPA